MYIDGRGQTHREGPVKQRFGLCSRARAREQGREGTAGRELKKEQRQKNPMIHDGGRRRIPGGDLPAHQQRQNKAEFDNEVVEAISKAHSRRVKFVDLRENSERARDIGCEEVLF